MERLEQAASYVVETAIGRGATSADAVMRENHGFSATVRMDAVETLKEAVSKGLLLRVFVGRRMATAYSSDTSPQVVDALIDETTQMARLTSEDDSGGLPEEAVGPAGSSDLGLLDEGWDELSPEERIGMARRAERAAFSTDPAIVNSEGAYFEYTRSRTVLANTMGFVGSYEGTASTIGVVAVAGTDGSMQRDYWTCTRRHRKDMESPETIGRKASERVLRRLGARKIPTCDVPVVFEPLAARSLLGSIFNAVSGESIYKRSSFLVGRIGERIASPAVTVIDDGLLVAGLGTSPFDDEGIPSRTTTVIEGGRLRSYLHSSYTARKLGARPTGNASRAMSGTVTIGPRNLSFRPGPHTPEEITRSVKTGLCVVELFGFGVNLVTGDYSRGAVGIWIENGQLKDPVHEVTIAGNLNDMLHDIEMVGNDVLFAGSLAAPTIKIRKMVISGN